MATWFKKAKLFLASLTAVGFLTSPLPIVPGETLALWDFNETSGGAIADSVTTDPMNGTSSANVQIVPTSDFGSSFNAARDFSTEGSYIDLGPIEGTKLDFSNEIEVAVEASIFLSTDATSPVSIFDNRQVQLQVINNRLAGFVRQGSGFIGVISEEPLSLQTPYHVGIHLKNGYMVITVDGRTTRGIRVEESIQPSEPGATAYIGGLTSGMNFPGLIDNVRVSNVVIQDTVPPSINILSPDINVPQLESQPNFIFEVLDNEDEVDPASIITKLNGQVVTGLNFDEQTNELSGQLSQILLHSQENTIEIQAKDLDGNEVQAQFLVSYIKRGSGKEYEADAQTLGLWHLNEYGNTWVKDSSQYNRDGKLIGTKTTEGMIGQARLFDGNSFIRLPPVTIPGVTYTFEAWVHPLMVSVSGSNIFGNDQIKIALEETGSVEVTMSTYYNSYTYQSAVDAISFGEWNHLKVVYDGTREENNLLIIVNGLIVSQLSAIPECEFDDTPELAYIGSSSTGYVGYIDEVRLSENIRESVNVIVGQPPEVDVAYPPDKATLKSENLSIYILMNDGSGINTADVEIKLNGIVQSGSGLNITPTMISGTVPDLLKPGVNTLEVRASDQEGNQTVVQRRIFYIADGGLSEYITDQDTVGLWHFNEPSGTGLYFDSSGNDFNIIAESSYDRVAGVLGGALEKTISGYGLDLSNIRFNGKSFTLEGWMSNSNDSWFLLQGDNLIIELASEPPNMRLRFSVPGADSFAVDIPEVIEGNRFNHMALIYDAEAPHSNIAVLANGKVVYTRDYSSYCRTCLSDVKLDFSGDFLVDETRLSNIARGEINVGTGQGPSISISQTAPESTVNTSQPEFSVYFVDDASIDQASMSLEVNGVVDANLTKTVSGTIGILSGTISENLVGGANKIKVRAKNQNGSESVQEFYVYYITKGASVAYSADANTMGLWHFNGSTSSEILEDSSGRSFDWTGISSPLTKTGIFDLALDTGTSYRYANASGTAIASTKNLTFEVWVKRSLTSSYLYQRINGTDVFNLNTNGQITYAFSQNLKTPENVIPQDGKFHHLALILDDDNPYKQILVVVDGKVVGSATSTSIPDFDFSAAGGGYWYGIHLDEMRLSNISRYTLSFEKPSSLLFRNAEKVLKRKELKAKSKQ